MQIHNVEQRSEEWYAVKAGVPSSSMFHAALAEGRGKTDSATRRSYMLRLAGERLTGEPMDSYQNHHMQRGIEREREALRLYAFAYDQKPHAVGFIRNGDIGCSPDGLIGADGLVEVKDKLPHLQIDVLDRGEVPSVHATQLQGQLLVTCRSWVDFVSHCRGLPLFVKRVHRDEKRIAQIKLGLQTFCDELEFLVEKIRAMQ